MGIFSGLGKRDERKKSEEESDGYRLSSVDMMGPAGGIATWTADRTLPAKDPLIVMTVLPQAPTTPLGTVRLLVLAADKTVRVMRTHDDGVIGEFMRDIEGHRSEGLEGVVIFFNNSKGVRMVNAMEITVEQKRAIDRIVEAAGSLGTGAISLPLLADTDDVIRHAIVEKLTEASVRPAAAVEIWEEWKRQGLVTG